MITKKGQFRISVFGLGYVGVVTAACFAKNGHKVIGIDVQPQKVELINQGKSPIVEKGLSEIICEQISAKNLLATTSSTLAVNQSDLSIVCVGTPTNEKGELNTKYIESVSKEIGEAIKKKESYHVVVIRSTLLPGTTRNVIIPIIEKASGKRAGDDFGICFNPEFLREATAVEDFKTPSKTVIGEFDHKSGEALTALYNNFPGPFFRTAIETAEMIKYADNSWHALKISFANEIGSICSTIGVDSHKVMKMFCEDTKLNISPCYLKPGFAFGGSCLPKDLRAITWMGSELKLDIPLLKSILLSNEAHIARSLQIIHRTHVKKIGVLGISFKTGTDDVRESPSVRLVESLIGEGYIVSIYDENIKFSELLGENQKFLISRIPSFLNLVRDNPDELMSISDVLIVTQNTPTYRNIIRKRKQGQIVVDLVHLEGFEHEKDYFILC
jgi:GDP-mannose 6-dehydrogenase